MLIHLLNFIAIGDIFLLISFDRGKIGDFNLDICDQHTKKQ